MVDHPGVRSACFDRGSPLTNQPPLLEAHGRLPSAPVTPPSTSAGSVRSWERGPPSPVGPGGRSGRRSQFCHPFWHWRPPSHSKRPAFDLTATRGRAVAVAFMCIKTHFARLRIIFAVLITMCHTSASRGRKATPFVIRKGRVWRLSG